MSRLSDLFDKDYGTAVLEPPQPAQPPQPSKLGLAFDKQWGAATAVAEPPAQPQRKWWEGGSASDPAVLRTSQFIPGAAANLLKSDVDKWTAPDWKSSIPDEKDWYFSKEDQAANIARFEQGQYRRKTLTGGAGKPFTGAHGDIHGVEGYIRSGAKPIGAKENLARGNVLEKLPFSPVAAAEMLDVWGSIKRLESEDFSRYTEAGIDAEKGKLRDQRVVDEYFKALQEQSVRGKTFMADVGSGVADLPAWMIEFYVTGGLAKFASKGVATAGLKFMGKYVKTQAGRHAIANVLRVGAATVITPTIRTLQQPHRVVEGAVGNMIQGDQPMTAWLKAGVSQNIENWSETMGGYITKGLRKVPVTKQVMGVFDDLAKARYIARGGTAEAFGKAIKAGGYDGLIGELGEEWLGGMSQALLGTETFGAEQTGDFLKDTQARLEAATVALTKQTPSMAATLAVPGAIKGGLDIAGRAGQEPPPQPTPVQPVKPQAAKQPAKVEPVGVKPKKPLNAAQQRNVDALAKFPHADVVEGTMRVRMKNSKGVVFQVPASQIQKKLDAGLTLVEKATGKVSQQQAYENYQEAMPNATDEEIVVAMIEDGIDPPPEKLEPSKHLPAVQNVLADQDIERKAAQVGAQVEKPVPVTQPPPLKEVKVKLVAKRPLVDPHASARKQDEQLRKQQAWDKKHAPTEAKPAPTEAAKGQTFEVYHGGPSSVQELDPATSDYGDLRGVYFTADKEYAQTFAEQHGKGEGIVRKYTITLQNPANDKLVDAKEAEAKELGYKEPHLWEWVTEELKAEGYDGAVLETGKATTEIIAFNKEAISPKPKAAKEVKALPPSQLKEKEIKREQEAIIEPAPSFKVEQGKTGKPVSDLTPTGKLDPTAPKDALEITKLHADWVSRGTKKEPQIAVGGVYSTKWDKEKAGYVIDSVEYTAEQIDTAYRLIEKPIESPMSDVSLFAMPGKEKRLLIVAEKMRRLKPPKEGKKKPKLAKPKALPKAKTKKEDYIKAVYVASAKESKRYALTGVFVEQGNLVATDGRRMFMAKGVWGKGGLYLDVTSLSKGVLGKVTKKGKFPKWQDIVPFVSTSDAIVVDDLGTVWRRVHQASLITSEESQGIIILVNKDGSLGFSAAAPEVGHSEINVWPGAKILTGVNPQFLIDAIAFHAKRGDTSIEFYFQEADRPILTRSPDHKTSTILMPVNIGETSDAIKEAIGESLARPAPKPTAAKAGKVKEPVGGAAGSSVAAAGAQAGSGYGTIAPSEKSLFAEKTSHRRVSQELPAKDKINVLDELLKIASPAHRVGSREGARVLRKNLGKLSQETVVAHESLKKAHHAFTFMNRADIYEFIDRMENGQPQLSPRLTQIAAKFRKLLDDRRDAVQALGKGHLQNFYENYFPHLWKDPKTAEKVIRQIFGKRRFEGSKSFLKKRTIMTVKEGREAGLELVSENPVDLVLLKLFEMDRYLMAHHVIQDLKSRSLIKFVYSRAMSPEGYKKIDDRAFTVYMPPEITKKEAYDSLMVEQLMNIARSIGVDAQRFVSIGGKRWGYAQWDPSQPKQAKKVRTKYAGPVSVLAHEIGHILGVRYDLYNTLRRAKEGESKKITRGKRKGEQKFVPTEEAVKHRKTIDVEWRALADARIKGTETTAGFKKYLRKAREKEAVMLESLIHAPKEFQRTAPTLFKLFKNFLNNHSELRPLLDLKPSLVLGESEAKIKIPGFTVLGHYYAPEPVAKVLNNYLSPGLRNNENILIAGTYNLLRQAGNMLNQAQLALSGFHALNVTTDMIASTLGHGVRQVTVKGQRLSGVANILTSPIAPLFRIWEGVRLRKAYKQQIDTIDDEKLRDMIIAVILADGRDRMDPFYYNQQIKALKKTLSDILKGAPKQKIKGAFKLPFNTFGAVLETLAKPLMEWYVPTGKMGLFSLLARHEMQRAEAGQISSEQLHERLISSWDSVDNRMGQLVYDNLFWNKTLKDVAMLSVRSVGWNLGSWREYGGVPVDILGTSGRLARGDVLLSQKMAYTIGAVVLYATLGAVIMRLLTGKDPEELKDYFFPKTGNRNPDGSDERLSLPTYAKDWFAYGTQPVKTVKHKLHPLWGLLADLTTNKDYFSTEVRHPGDPISQQLLDVAEHIGKEFLPLSVRNYKKMQKAEPSGKNVWVSITGITSAPSYIVRSPAQKLMYRYIVENIPDRTRTRESQELYEYRRLIKNRLRKGDPVDSKAVIGRIGKTSFNRLVSDAKKEPFAEAFNRLSFAQALNVYAIATPAERKLARPLLVGKHGRARKISDEMKTVYKELISK